MNYHRETANQTLKNQTTGNVEIRCRLEKIDKTENSRLRKAVFHRSMPGLMCYKKILYGKCPSSYDFICPKLPAFAESRQLQLADECGKFVRQSWSVGAADFSRRGPTAYPRSEASLSCSCSIASMNFLSCASRPSVYMAGSHSIFFRPLIIGAS
jgi:hypothetical protein